MEMLSEHTVEGWLEGYILSGRHGMLNSYEPFIHIIDSMVNQHAKWIEKCLEVSWREKVSSLNILLTATVWRQGAFPLFFPFLSFPFLSISFHFLSLFSFPSSLPCPRTPLTVTLHPLTYTKHALVPRS